MIDFLIDLNSKIADNSRLKRILNQPIDSYKRSKLNKELKHWSYRVLRSKRAYIESLEAFDHCLALY